VHKTERGKIAVDLRDAGAVEDAATAIKHCRNCLKILTGSDS